MGEAICQVFICHGTSAPRAKLYSGVTQHPPVPLHTFHALPRRRWVEGGMERISRYFGYSLAQHALSCHLPPCRPVALHPPRPSHLLSKSRPIPHGWTPPDKVFQHRSRVAYQLTFHSSATTTRTPPSPTFSSSSPSSPSFPPFSFSPSSLLRLRRFWGFRCI